MKERLRASDKKACDGRVGGLLALGMPNKSLEKNRFLTLGVSSELNHQAFCCGIYFHGGKCARCVRTGCHRGSIGICSHLEQLQDVLKARIKQNSPG